MVFLINSIPVLIILIALFVIYKVSGLKRKVGTALIAIGLSVIYTHVQPSYMPKGTVKPLPVVETPVVDKPIVDRVLKPMSGAERDARMKAEVEKSDARRAELIKEIKSEKE